MLAEAVKYLAICYIVRSRVGSREIRVRRAARAHGGGDGGGGRVRFFFENHQALLIEYHRLWDTSKVMGLAKPNVAPRT